MSVTPSVPILEQSKPPEYLARQIAKAPKAASDPDVADGRRHRPLFLDLNRPHGEHDQLID
jgi:hypothetical protein